MASKAQIAKAEKAAKRYVEVLLELKKLTKEKKQLAEQLEDYVERTGELEIGPVMAYTKTTNSLVPVNEKVKKDDAIATLVASLPDEYIKKTFSTADIIKAATKAPIKALLRKAKLQVTAVESWYFKHI